MSSPAAVADGIKELIENDTHHGAVLLVNDSKMMLVEDEKTIWLLRFSSRNETYNVLYTVETPFLNVQGKWSIIQIYWIKMTKKSQFSALKWPKIEMYGIKNDQKLKFTALKWLKIQNYCVKMTKI